MVSMMVMSNRYNKSILLIQRQFMYVENSIVLFSFTHRRPEHGLEHSAGQSVLPLQLSAIVLGGVELGTNLLQLGQLRWNVGLLRN